jgi:pantoate kinase
VECHTGLGDVGAQAMGGLVVGLREGGPPYGKWIRIQVEPDLKVICCTLGPISTKKFLTNEKFTQKAKRCGRVAMKKLLRNLTLRNFLHTSYEFSKDIGLLDDELDTLIKEGKKAGAIGGSVVMMGKAIFLFTPTNRLKQVKRALLEHCAPEQLMITEVGSRAHYLV